MQDRGRPSSPGSRSTCDTAYFGGIEINMCKGLSRGRAPYIWRGVYGEKKCNFAGQHFWARGYFVSTVGRDAEVIQEYVSPGSRKRKASACSS
jgi:hypothetical protein